MYFYLFNTFSEDGQKWPKDVGRLPHVVRVYHYISIQCSCWYTHGDLSYCSEHG